MRSYTKSHLYTFMIILLLALSVVWTVPVHADGETPPAEPSVTTEEVDQTPPPPVTVSTETPAPILAEVPANFQPSLTNH